MTDITEMIQSADWTKEKHVPVLETEGALAKGQPIMVKAVVGKEIPHPNTTEHHIEWIEVFFHPTGDKFPYCIGRSAFPSHGASAQGPNTSTVYTEPRALFSFKTEKPGMLYAISSCNIHGLWKSKLEIKLE